MSFAQPKTSANGQSSPVTTETPFPSRCCGMVSIITVNYNGERHLRDWIESLLSQDYPTIELTVVDNGSQDGSRALVAEYAAQGVKWVDSGGNVGLGAGYNVGAATSQGEYLFLVNNDMRFDRHCVSALVAALERGGPNCFAADAMQYNWDGTEIIHYRCLLRGIERPIELFSDVFSLVPPLKRVYGRCDADAPIPFANGGSMMVRAELYAALGGFDARFFLDWEDVDICWRANRRGWHCVFAPEARLYHRWGGTSQAEAQRDRSEGKRGFSQAQLRMSTSQQYNMMQFALKNTSVANATLIALSRLVGGPLYLLRRKPEVGIGGILAFGKFLVNLPTLLRAWRILARSSQASFAALLARFRQDKEPFALVWPSEKALPLRGAEEIRASASVAPERGV